jgi:hypothetical protein
MVSTCSANLTLLPGASGDSKTMEWWKSQPAAWEATRATCGGHAETRRVAQGALPAKPVFVGYPVAYDFMFVHRYLIRLAGESPFPHSALTSRRWRWRRWGATTASR